MKRGPEWDRIIVEKGRQYVRSGRLAKMYQKDWVPDMTPHLWDAKPFSSYSLAARIAGQIGGKVRSFDMLEGRLR